MIIVPHINDFKSNIDNLSNLVLEAKIDGLEYTINQIINKIKTIDDDFFYGGTWKENYNSNGFANKTIYSTTGEFTLRRRVYIPKDKTSIPNNYYHVDNCLGIEKHSRFTKECIAYIMTLTTDVNGSYAARNAIPGHFISRQTVTNYIKKLVTSIDGEPVIEDHQPSEIKSVKTMFVELDEAHCNLQLKGNKSGRGKNRMVNLALIHEGLNDATLASKRKELKNKHYLGGVSRSTSSIADGIYEYLDLNYNLNELEYLFISGDGAHWIASVFNKLKYTLRKYNNLEVIPVLDSFHMRKVLNSIFKGNRSVVNTIVDNILQYNEQTFRNVADNFYKMFKEHRLKPDAFRRKVEYICNHLTEIKNQKHVKYTTRCSMEGHISHVLARALTSRPKGFSITVLENRVQMLIYKANGKALTTKEIIKWEQTYNKYKHPSLYTKRYKPIYDCSVRLAVLDSTSTNTRRYFSRLANPRFKVF